MSLVGEELEREHEDGEVRHEFPGPCELDAVLHHRGD